MEQKISKISKSGLAIILSKLDVFESPKVRVEQYVTDAEIAASALWNGLYLGDLRQKVSVDLGCGTGILGIGALILGAKEVYFVDNDENALKQAKINYKRAKSEYSIEGKAVFLCISIDDFNEKCDTVVQNPPFGVKVRHADRKFLKKAIKIAPVVYSFHKSESKGFINAFSEDNGYIVSHKWDFEFPLKATMSFHKKRIKRIKVSCFRLERDLYKK